jgi:hypothetical protein
MVGRGRHNFASDREKGTSRRGQAASRVSLPRWPSSRIRRRSSSNRWQCSSIQRIRSLIWAAERSSSSAMENEGEGAAWERKRGTLLLRMDSDRMRTDMNSDVTIYHILF